MLLVAAAAYAAAIWPDRPRGWCFRKLVQGFRAASDPLQLSGVAFTHVKAKVTALSQVGPSTVAGTGVFARVSIQAGTVLGAYPGRPRPGHSMAAKCQTAPNAAAYCFRTRGGLLLDPTDSVGQLSEFPAHGLPWLPVDYTLAYVNEPPRGAGGTNVTVEDDPDDPNGLLCVAAMDITAGQELYMDYGVHYDRSGYRQGHQQDQLLQQQEEASGGKAPG